MSQVISFTDYAPAARYDAVPWTKVQVEEGPTSSGTWTTIDTLNLSPLDSDPANPLTRNLTVTNASDTPGLWYRLTFIDAVGDLGQPSTPIQNASGHNYVELDRMKATLELTGATFADDDISVAIAAASRWIDEACGRRFYPDTDANQVRQFVPINGDVALIDDLCELTSLATQGSVWTLDTDFFLEPINAAADGEPWTAIRTIARPFIFPLSQQQQGWAGFDGRIQVTGKWGWAQTPDAIISATTILAGRLLNRARSPLGIVGVGVDGVGVRLSRLDPDVQALIGPYTRSFIV